jgi:hypothetical protein
MTRPTIDVTKITRAAFDYTVPIYWKNASGTNIDGGSWWDSTATGNGLSAWATQTVSSLTQVNFDVTSLFQAIYDNANWTSAVIIGAIGSSTQQFAGNTNTNTTKRPKISYDGGADQSATNEVGINYGSSGGIPNASDQYVTPDLGTSGTWNRWIIDLPPPSTRPTSATLKVWSTYVGGTNDVKVFWLRYPPESAPTLSSTVYEFASFNRGVGRGIARGIA